LKIGTLQINFEHLWAKVVHFRKEFVGVAFTNMSQLRVVTLPKVIVVDLYCQKFTLKMTCNLEQNVVLKVIPNSKSEVGWRQYYLTLIGHLRFKASSYDLNF